MFQPTTTACSSLAAVAIARAGFFATLVETVMSF
jgi:hypothetical protein